MITEEKTMESYWKPEYLERLKNFRLMDDDFMSKCFDGDPKYIELVLRTVIEKPDLRVLEVRTQVFAENLLKRSVRFDVLAVDDANRFYNVEIQRQDKGAGERRARYNSSMLDSKLLRKGEDFSDIPDTYVIFITENDVIGEGKPVYKIQSCFVDTGKVFEDGSHIVYVNGAYRGDTPIGKLMHDFACANPDDMYNEVLADRVKFFKESKEGIAVMCRSMEELAKKSYDEGVSAGMEKGMEKGAEENKVKNAEGLLKDGTLSVEKIAAILGLSLEEVEKLKKNLAMN